MKKNRKPLIAGIIIAVVVILLAAASTIAYAVYQHPQRVVTDAVMSLVTAESITHKGTFTLRNDTAGETVDTEIAFDGGISKDGIVTNATIKISKDGRSASTKVETVIGSDQAVYVKINDPATFLNNYAGLSGSNEFSKEDLATVFKNTLATLENKWIEVDLKETQGFDESAAAQKCFQDLAEKLKQDKAITNDIKKAYTDNQFISIKKELGIKNINGTNSIGYELGTDDAKAKAFFEKLNSSTLAGELKKCDKDANFSYDNVSSEDNPSSVFELWAAQFGHSLTRLEVRGSNTDNGTSRRIVFEPKINTSVTVTTPTDTVSTQTLFEAFKKDTETIYAL